MTDVAIQEQGEVIRSLKVLEQLIKKDFENAEQAGMEYYKAAGDKLSEAREGHYKGNAKGFFAWAEENFGKKPNQIRTYIGYATVIAHKPFKSLRNFRQDKEYGFGRKDPKPVYRDWTAPVDAIVNKARNDMRRLAFEDAITKQQEREAESKLGLRLIDIGYKVLARELHPDKRGGSREAMSRLNKVRERLRANI